jgi:hypothetical protein
VQNLLVTVDGAESSTLKPLDQLMTVVAITAVVALAVATTALWLLSIRYAVEREKVTMPGGPTFDVLAHRDGVVLYTKTAGYLNTAPFFAMAVAFVCRWRRGPWPWAVTVRQAPFSGYKNLLHEVFDDRETARQRARGVAALVKRGERLWPAEWEL